MRAFIAVALLFLAALLLILAAQWAGWIPPDISGPEGLLLRGLVVVLVIGMLAAGARTRSITLHQQELLEKQVAERTEELRVANRKLEEENRLRQNAEEALAQRAAEQLSVAEARFQAMFDAAAVGMGILGLDRRI